MSGLRARVDDGLRWWQGELLGCLPLSWREAWARQVPTAYVRLGNDGCVIELIDADETRQLANEHAIDQWSDEDWELLHDLILTRRTTLVLAFPLSFARHVSLPKQAHSRAAAALDLQLDMIAPVRADALAWTWTWNDASASAEVAMTRLSTLRHIEQLLAARSLPMPALALDSSTGPLPLELGFDGGDTPARRLNRRLWIAAGLALFAIPLLTYALLALQISFAQDRVASLDARYGDQLSAQARAQALAPLYGSARALADRPAGSELLALLARVLPAEARVQTLNLTDHRVRAEISGVSADELRQVLAPSMRELVVYPAAAAQGGMSVTIEFAW